MPAAPPRERARPPGGACSRAAGPASTRALSTLRLKRPDTPGPAKQAALKRWPRRLGARWARQPLGTSLRELGQKWISFSCRSPTRARARPPPVPRPSPVRVLRAPLRSPRLVAIRDPAPSRSTRLDRTLPAPARASRAAYRRFASGSTPQALLCVPSWLPSTWLPVIAEHPQLRCAGPRTRESPPTHWRCSPLVQRAAPKPSPLSPVTLQYLSRQYHIQVVQQVRIDMSYLSRRKSRCGAEHLALLSFAVPDTLDGQGRACGPQAPPCAQAAASASWQVAGLGNRRHTQPCCSRHVHRPRNSIAPARMWHTARVKPNEVEAVPSVESMRPTAEAARETDLCTAISDTGCPRREPRAHKDMAVANHVARRH